MLRRIKLDSETYYKIIEYYKEWVVYDDLNQYLADGYSQKSLIVVDKNTNSLICQGRNINFIAHKNVSVESWRQYVCELDISVDEPGALVPWATQANKKINTILLKYYTEEEIEERLNEKSTEEEVKPIHQLLPDKYLDGQIHKFYDCVYYDINGAHTDALCEIFPKAKKRLMSLHHNGFKSYINIYVGDLCNRGHRNTYNWIVRRTRNWLQKIINLSCGPISEIIYANTDGVIIYRPMFELRTCDDVGGFKSETKDGVIYAYYCPRDDNTTSYTVYQYDNPKKGIQIKGNARLALRKGMDLSKGIVNKCKLVRNEEGIEQLHNYRTEDITIHEEI